MEIIKMSIFSQFECQINTSPPLVLTVHLEVIGEYWAHSKASWVLCCCLGENSRENSPPPHLFMFYYTRASNRAQPPSQFNLRFYDTFSKDFNREKEREREQDARIWNRGSPWEEILCVEISFSVHTHNFWRCDMWYVWMRGGRERKSHIQFRVS